MLELAFLSKPAHTLDRIAAQEISRFLRSSSSQSARSLEVLVEFATLSDLSFVEKWRDTLGTNPEPKQREAVDLAQLAQERFLADSRVGQQYLTALDDLRDHIARDPNVKLAASSSSDVTGLPALKSSGSATS